IVIQQAKCVKIWGREGRLGHVEVFLQMCCFVTSIFERPRLFLCLQHARIRKLIYTQNSEEPPNVIMTCTGAPQIWPGSPPTPTKYMGRYPMVPPRSSMKVCPTRHTPPAILKSSNATV